MHDFCSERGAMAQRFGFDMAEIREAVPRLNAFIERCRAAGVLVTWVREIFADYIALVADCTGAPTPAEYESGVFNIGTYFGKVSTSADLADLWEREPAAVTP